MGRHEEGLAPKGVSREADAPNQSLIALKVEVHLDQADHEGGVVLLGQVAVHLCQVGVARLAPCTARYQGSWTRAGRILGFSCNGSALRWGRQDAGQ